MRGLLVQDAIVGTLAVLALAYLIWLRVRRKSKLGCEDCPGCASAPAPASEPILLTIASPAPARRSSSSADQLRVIDPNRDRSRRSPHHD